MKTSANLLSVALAIALISGTFLFAKDNSIAYKTKKSLSKSFQDSSEAEKHLQALTKLGCKVSRQQAEGAVVVQYECPKWQSISVSTEKLAHQWETWLKEAGFEIVHGHSENHAHSEKEDHGHGKGHEHGKTPEELQYRLAQKVTLHPEEDNQYQELIAILKGLGCAVDIDSHDGHTDIIVQCNSWMHAEFSSHQSAQDWEKWLKGFGFEVRHAHEHH